MRETPHMVPGGYPVATLRSRPDPDAGEPLKTSHPAAAGGTERAFVVGSAAEIGIIECSNHSQR